METNDQQYAAPALQRTGYDFAEYHVEDPDEMGHQGSLEKKLQAIEYLDTRVIQRVKERMDVSKEPYKMLVLPDHPTPIWYPDLHLGSGSVHAV